MAVAAAVIAVSLVLPACGNDSEKVTTDGGATSLGRPIGGEPRAPSSAGGTDARVAARAFLASYLAVSYGHAKAAQLRNATGTLRDRLRAQAARVPPGVEDRRPEVVALRLESVADGQVRATATVDDGDVAPYPLFATLTRQARGRWVAVSVGG